MINLKNSMSSRKVALEYLNLTNDQLFTFIFVKFVQEKLDKVVQQMLRMGDDDGKNYFHGPVAFLNLRWLT